MSNVKIPARFIAVTANYGLVPDDTCFVLYRLATVDPRRSPGYSGDMSEAVLRQEWRDDKRYYNLTPGGLQHALREISVKQVTTAVGQTDIGRFIGALDEYVTRIERLVPEVSVDE